MEFTHFKSGEACSHLQSCVASWSQANEFDDSTLLESEWVFADDRDFWETVHLRAPLYLSGSDGWSLYCFLVGARRGGDWLQLEATPTFDLVYDEIARRSLSAYGTEFAAFRVYDAQRLLEMCGYGSGAEG